MTQKYHLFIVDDDESFRDSIGPLLVSNGYGITFFQNGVDFLREIEKDCPSVILLDMQLPDMTGVEIQANLKKRSIECPIIFISGQSHNRQVADGLKAGANDFLFKPFGSDELLTAIDLAIKSGEDKNISLRVTNSIREKFETLTSREKSIFKLLCQGKQNTEIGALLKISPATVKIHKSRVMEKMRASSTAELAQQFLKGQFTAD